MSVCFTNATCISLDPPTVFKGAVRAEGGLLAAVGSSDEVKPAAGDEVVDLNGGVLCTGLVVGHHHLYSALARGMPAPPKAPTNFPEILERVWWVLDRCLDAETVEISGLVGLLGAVRCGATAVVDHHASPSCTPGSLTRLAKSFEAVGVRGVLCYEVSDRAGRDEARRGIDENNRFMESVNGKGASLLRGVMGGHASFTLSDDSLGEMAQSCERAGVGLHIHVLEDAADRTLSVESYGAGPLERLDTFGLLNEKALVVHGVHLTAEERALVAKRGATLIHNGRSNMNNAVGRSPLGLLEHDGVKVALGTDGIDGDILTEARCAFFRGREEETPASFGFPLEMLRESQRLVARHFDAPVGKLQPGAPADLTLLSYVPQTPMEASNLAGHLFFGGLGPENVHSVMVDGRFILRNGEFVNVDTAATYERARGAAKGLWAAMKELWKKELSGA